MGAFADIIAKVFPGWAQRAPRSHWGQWLELLALHFDAQIEIVNEARLAEMPGQVDSTIAPNLGGFISVDALQVIGRDRRRPRGLANSTPQYAQNLRTWLDDFRRCATPFGLLDELARILRAPGQDDPLLRCVTGRGAWYTRHPDGTWRYNSTDGDGWYLEPDGTSGADATVAHQWNWDSTSKPVPADQNDNTRVWIIIYPPAASPYLTQDDDTFADPGVYGDGWDDPNGGYENSPDAGTFGTNAPYQLVEMVRGTVLEWRAGGFRCPWIIIAFDPDSFRPNGTSTGSQTAYPDGNWAWHTKYDAGTNTQIPARLTTAEYWKGA